MMATDPSSPSMAPRINSSMMDRFRGKTVRMVGRRLPQRSEDVLLLEVSDKGQVDVKINPHEHFPQTEYVEILGQVGQGTQVLAYVVTDFGDKFDLESYDKLVKLREQFPEVF